MMIGKDVCHDDFSDAELTCFVNLVFTVGFRRLRKFYGKLHMGCLKGKVACASECVFAVNFINANELLKFPEALSHLFI